MEHGIFDSLFSHGSYFSLDKIPKISLHDHLDGGLRASTIVEIAGEISYDLPEQDPEKLASWFVATASKGSLVEYLKTFEVTVSLMQREQDLVRVAREFVEDLAADGVIHAEIRWAPEQHQRQGLSLVAAVEAVQRGIDEAVSSLAGEGKTLSVSQILIAMRHEKRSLEIAQLAIAFREKGVCAFDIAGPEAGFLPHDHREAFDLLAKHHMPVTVHAGEGAGCDSIRGAIFDGRTLRIGHGVRMSEDIGVGHDGKPKLGELATWLRDRRIPLEIAVTSNLHTAAIDGATVDTPNAHPFDLLYRAGLTVTVNPDNRLTSGTTLTKELQLLQRTFGYTFDDIEKFQLNAAEAAFLPLDAKKRLADQIRKAFAHSRSAFEEALARCPAL